jgi:la-related protein 1
MDSEGYLPITLIASFHRVQALSSDVALVLASVKESDKLEVYKDFKIRTKYDPLKWPMPNVGGEVPVNIRPEIIPDHPPPAPAFVPILIAAPPPVSEVLSNIPPPPILRNSRKNASDTKPPQHVTANVVVNNVSSNSSSSSNNNIDIKVLPSSSSSSASSHQNQNSTNDHLNPDVTAFVPKSSPKNEVANAAAPPAANANMTSEANKTQPPKSSSSSTATKNANARKMQTPRNTNSTDSTETTEDANIWKEVKRRSKTSQQQKEASLQAGGGEHKPEKEELDFQFDEEMHFDDETIPHGGGRINNFSEFSDDEESDYELSDRDINKLLIVTQVNKTRPPKHEGESLLLPLHRVFPHLTQMSLSLSLSFTHSLLTIITIIIFCFCLPYIYVKHHIID